MSKTCETCKHCRAAKILEEFGGGVQHECHYNPPATVRLPPGYNGTNTMGFPWVRPDDWCREHTLKEAA